MASFKFTHAIVCRVPESLQVDVEEAKRQHEAYVRTLRELGVDVIELPPEKLCVFVEDTAVVVNGLALVARPGHESRENEVQTVRAVLKKELDLPIVEIGDEKARLDGGDVLFTGKEFFVGISKRTDEAGARAVAAAFPEFPCTPIKVPEDSHLKTFISMAGPDVMCVGEGQVHQEVLKRVEREATFRYRTLTVPEDIASNVMYVNGCLIHRSADEIPKSFTVFGEKVDYARRWLSISELAKASGSLTACSVLIRKTKHLKNL